MLLPTSLLVVALGGQLGIELSGARSLVPPGAQVARSFGADVRAVDGGYLLVWADDRVLDEDRLASNALPRTTLWAAVYGAGTGKLGWPRQVCGGETGTTHLARPRLFAADGGFGVLFRASRDGGDELRAVTLDETGQRLDDCATKVLPWDSAPLEDYVGVSASGASYAVADRQGSIVWTKWVGASSGTPTVLDARFMAPRSQLSVLPTAGGAVVSYLHEMNTSPPTVRLASIEASAVTRLNDGGWGGQRAEYATLVEGKVPHLLSSQLSGPPLLASSLPGGTAPWASLEIGGPSSRAVGDTPLLAAELSPGEVLTLYPGAPLVTVGFRYKTDPVSIQSMGVQISGLSALALAAQRGSAAVVGLNDAGALVLHEYQPDAGAFAYRDELTRLPSAPGRLAVTWVGTEWLVTWTTREPGGDRKGAWAAALATDGTLGPAQPVRLAGNGWRGLDFSVPDEKVWARVHRTASGHTGFAYLDPEDGGFSAERLDGDGYFAPGDFGRGAAVGGQGVLWTSSNLGNDQAVILPNNQQVPMTRGGRCIAYVTAGAWLPFLEGQPPNRQLRLVLVTSGHQTGDPTIVTAAAVGPADEAPCAAGDGTRVGLVFTLNGQVQVHVVQPETGPAPLIGMAATQGPTTRRPVIERFDGGWFVAFEQRQTMAPDGVDWRVRALVRWDDGGTTPALELDDESPDTIGLNPQVSRSPSGGVAVVWERHGTEPRIGARVVLPQLVTTPDGGQPPVDGGAPDGGEADAGSAREDGGTGEVDGSHLPDGGSSTLPVQFSSCGCQSVDGGLLALLLAPLALPRRRPTPRRAAAAPAARRR